MKALTTRQAFAEDIRKETGCSGYVSKTKLAGYMGISRNDNDRLVDLLKGCRFITTGRGNQYKVIDVAEKLTNIECFELGGKES